ncbi:hypothetical protein OEA41_003371 [Lepraria neglecta]|uniref:Expansin-like EG45 domain-containing protein n=1 Tax=Lepraria neglecta TaxID=209136 RepID=A0AAD9Z6V3_9LECA|nr:hypothetical protein OEA41_003371 [Lepraria neglecta]
MNAQLLSLLALLVTSAHVYAQSVGSCSNITTEGGWQGVASISYYAYMGTACNCGNGNEGAANWQGNTGAALGIGQGYYSGAVNQLLFQGNMASGEPNCGSGCGVCYELQTTGVNAYNGGVGPGSSITVMVVDACHNNNGAPNWCTSATGGPDDFGCIVHFDIDTDPTAYNPTPPNPVGQDGTQWANGGEFVQYRQVIVRLISRWAERGQ